MLRNTFCSISGSGSIKTRSDEIRQIETPPSQACLRMKVVYNNDFVNDAGEGDLTTAHQVAKDVIDEAQHVFNNRFTTENRLGTTIIFNLIAGNISRSMSCTKGALIIISK